MIVHASPDWECVACWRKFRSASGMLIHLETRCGARWNEAATRLALRMFSEYNPTDYKVAVWLDRVVKRGCQGKVFKSVSALCQHLESDACGGPILGPCGVSDFVRMLERSQSQVLGLVDSGTTLRNPSYGGGIAVIVIPRSDRRIAGWNGSFDGDLWNSTSTHQATIFLFLKKS